MKNTVVALATLGFLALANPVLAQHSDIGLGVNAGKIVLVDHAHEGEEHEHGSLIDAATGYRIVEGDFGDLAKGPFGTANPGFAADAGAFIGGTILGYRALGALEYWNGSIWTLSTPGAEQVHIVDTFEQHSIYSPTGVSGAGIGLIGQTSANGSLHEHINFLVENTGGAGDPGIGAYLILLSILSVDASANPTTAYIESDPIYLLFNRGLSSVDFELAVDARVSEVPLPAAGPLMAGALAIGAALARRRRVAVAA